MKTRFVVAQALTLTAGLLAGFFFVLNFLFSDGPTDPWHPERLVTYALVIGGALLPAVLGARFGGGGSLHRWALLACGPGLAVALSFLVGGLVAAEADLVALPALYAVGSIAGGWGGARLGVAWAGKSGTA